MTADTRRIELERADASRSAFEAAANRLESYPTNDLYRKAFKLAASLIRGLKDERDV